MNELIIFCVFSYDYKMEIKSTPVVDTLITKKTRTRKIKTDLLNVEP